MMNAYKMRKFCGRPIEFGRILMRRGSPGSGQGIRYMKGDPMPRDASSHSMQSFNRVGSTADISITRVGQKEKLGFGFSAGIAYLTSYLVIGT